MRKNKSKYDDLVSVCWRDVLRCLEWALRVRCLRAGDLLDAVMMDIDHRYPDCLERDLRYALGACERVIYYFELLNSLRRFLRYNSKTVDQLKIRRYVEFYQEKSPDSADVAAFTIGGNPKP